MIKRIVLTNFMSHEHSVFELTEGLNVLVGPNNCGKSSVVTALQILCYNDNSMYVLRHGAKECSVLVETDDGHTVRWSRKKNGSPRYEIDGETFDRLGRGKVPDALHKVLRMPRVQSETEEFDVHFGEQRNPVFLLNDRPRAAADFFASSSDAVRLVEMQTLHKKKVADAGSQQKQLQRESAEVDAALRKLEPVAGARQRLETAEQQWRDIRQNEEGLEHLRILLGCLLQNRRDRTLLESRLAQLQSLPPLPDTPDLLPVETLVARIGETELNQKSLLRRTTALESLATPPELPGGRRLQESIEAQSRLEEQRNRLLQRQQALKVLPPFREIADVSGLLQLAGSLANQLKSDGTLKKKLGEIERQLIQTRQDVEQWTSRNPECPTCGGPVTAGQLIADGGHDHDPS